MKRIAFLSLLWIIYLVLCSIAVIFGISFFMGSRLSPPDVEYVIRQAICSALIIAVGMVNIALLKQKLKGLFLLIPAMAVSILLSSAVEMFKSTSFSDIVSNDLQLNLTLGFAYSIFAQIVFFIQIILSFAVKRFRSRPRRM